LKEPVKVPLVAEQKGGLNAFLAMAPSLKARVMLSLAFIGCGMA